MMQPLLFLPIFKRIRWGGRRLATLLGKAIGPESDYAESWELVDHGQDQSLVSQGEFSGWTLERLVRERNQELFGKHAGCGQFPLLVKFLDANDRLSLQVHPDDAQAKTYDPKENGKTEAWVIVHAEPGSQLYAGLKEGVDRATFEKHLASDDLESCLHQFEVTTGDCVFIPAGTVHAITEGIVLAEIQQSSDLTFRLHDWGRVGTDGKPRPLHIEQSLACIDFDRGPVSPVVPQSISAIHDCQQLVATDYFVMHRHRSSQPFRISVEKSFHVLMILAGAAQLKTDNFSLTLSLGQTVLLPAACPDVELVPQGNQPCTVLDAFLP